MDNYEQMNVSTLKDLARQRGLRGYSRLRKSELIQRLRASILDQDIDPRMANVPFLTPTPYTPLQATSASSSSSNDVKDLIDYLDKETRRPKNLSYRSVPELGRLLKLIKLRKEIHDIYKGIKILKVKETDSALRGFARVYTIDGKLGFDPQSFLDGARENAIRVLRDNQNTKVKLILKCYMEFPARNEIKPANFHSCIEVNYDIILMLIEERGVKHYCLVKNPSRLLSSQVSNHKEKYHFCLRCLNPFWSHESLSKHREYCGKYEAVKIQMPEKGTMLEFKNHHRSEKVPFIVFTDFECYKKPIQSCDPNPESSYTKRYQKHEPSSFCYYIKCFDDEVYEYKPEIVSYTGEDAVQKFVEMLEEDIKIIANIREKKMIFGKEEKERFDEETKCWICNKKFDGDDKVRDHCHFTGRYRGAAHNSCNLKYRKPFFTPTVFHNLSGYDSHLFIRNLGFSEGNIDCIPNNEERYISFTNRIQVGSYMKEVKNKKGENCSLRK